MTLADHRRLHLQQRALDELRDRIGRDSYLSVKEVVERLNLSREKVEALPVEILPFTDFGLGTRALKRYHPADVLAVDAKLRRCTNSHVHPAKFPALKPRCRMKQGLTHPRRRTCGFIHEVSGSVVNSRKSLARPGLGRFRPGDRFRAGSGGFGGHSPQNSPQLGVSRV